MDEKQLANEIIFTDNHEITLKAKKYNETLQLFFKEMATGVAHLI